MTPGTVIQYIRQGQIDSLTKSQNKVMRKSINQTLLCMKLTAVFLMITCLQLAARNIHAQQVTLSEKKAPLEKIFKQITRQSGYDFMYTRDVIGKAKPVDIDVAKVTLEKALELCFKDQPLSYTIIEKLIVVKEKRSGVVTGETPAPLPLPPTVRGRITNEKGEAVAGVSISLKNGKVIGVTNDNGEFVLTNVADNAVLVFSAVTMETFETGLNGRTELALHSKTKISQLETVEVVNTGYQTIAKERATGSFVKVDNELFSRGVSTNVLDRLDGVTSGTLFNRNKVRNTPDVSVRGLSTLFANSSPLIVLDNFPYTGDLSNINPNDVESVTVLKDATASSIWGALSANGVIVITTKKGRINQPAKITINSNVTVSDRPDIYYKPQLTSSEFIEVERFLFDKGRYSSQLSNIYSVISPAVALLAQNKTGSLSNADLEAKLGLLKGIDARQGLEKYFYRPAVNQQYSININGGGANQTYFLSAGMDKNLANFSGTSFDRLTLNAKNTYYFFDRKLEISSGVLYTSAKTLRNNNPYNPVSPYEQVVDASGNALGVVRDYRKAYVDTAGGARLLDWTYKPINERDANSTKELIDYRINFELGYRVIPSLRLSLNYQYGNGNADNSLYYGVNSYYARNLINNFSQIQGGTLSRGIPLGDIINKSQQRYKNNYLRAQVGYDKTFGSRHNITAIAGYEIKDYYANDNGLSLYGYDPSTATNIRVDYLAFFSQYAVPGSTKRIPDASGQSESTDRFRSYYANVAYAYNDRYVFSVSARRDESNLFGVKTNQKGIPLWSAGVAWNISRENFYQVKWLPLLKLRLTNGYNGNVDKTTSAYTTAQIESSPNSFGANYATITNPPNPELRWEKVHMINAGIDFSSRNSVVSGSIEYYIKYGEDLIGNGPIAPQTGLAQFRGNVADLRTTGLDIVVNTKNINGAVKWGTNFLVSFCKDIVTKYKVLQSSNSAYINTNALNPLEGKPYSAILSYPWAGLDTAGNPLGYVNGKVSKDYIAISQSLNLQDLVYSGPAVPTVFGSVRNNFSWKNLDLSFNITFKAGYYFRKNSLNYSNLFGGDYRQDDFEKRWMKKGDEATTIVPSLIYPENNSRDAFYTNSEVLVEKGDHVRLQDLRISYTLGSRGRKMPWDSMKFYVYANNLGILWKASHTNVDPDATSGFPASRSFAIGLTAVF
jgi:TonB-linked SusC/RagA family outer membrane protein